MGYFLGFYFFACHVSEAQYVFYTFSRTSHIRVLSGRVAKRH